MKKDFDSEAPVSGLFAPAGYPLFKNWGRVRLFGWFDRDRLKTAQKVRVRVGKRIIDTDLNDCGVFGGSNEGDVVLQLFEFDVKVGPGLKRLIVSIVDELGAEHLVAKRFVYQKNRVEISLNEDHEEPEMNDYEKWLNNHEKHLRSASIKRSSEMAFPVTITWILEIVEGYKPTLDRTLRNLLSFYELGHHVCLIDNGNYFSGWDGKRRKLAYESHPAIQVFGKKQLNEACEELGSEWLVFLKEGDEVEQDLKEDFYAFLSTHQDTKLFYTDYDHRSIDGSLGEPEILPAWNRDFLTSYPYFAAVFLVKRSIFSEQGGFGDEVDHRNWSLLLKISRVCKRGEVGRLCGVYFHLGIRRQVIGTEESDAEVFSMLDEHLKLTGEKGTVSQAPCIAGWRIKYDVPLENGICPKVSLLIPTRDGVDVLATCVDSILDKTDYPNFEILILDNDSEKPETFQYFESIKEKGCKIVSCPGKFNYSQINNRGAMAADGVVLGFLNNDLEIIDGTWLTEMVSQAMRPDIGAVGAKLLYPDGTLQHAGVLLGVGHVAAHAFRLFEDNPDKGPLRAHLVQNYSVVTAACLLVRKEVFLEVGGFDDVDLAITNNDVDLCVKIRQAGFRNLYTPFATLSHHESATRGPEDTPEKKERYGREVDYMWKTWSSILMDDPAYNRLLTRFKEDFSLAAREELDHYIPGRIF